MIFHSEKLNKTFHLTQQEFNYIIIYAMVNKEREVCTFSALECLSHNDTI